MKITLIQITVALILLSAFPLIIDQFVNGDQSGVVWYFWVGMVLFLSGLCLMPGYLLFKWIFKW